MYAALSRSLEENMTLVEIFASILFIGWLIFYQNHPGSLEHSLEVLCGGLYCRLSSQSIIFWGTAAK